MNTKDRINIVLFILFVGSIILLILWGINMKYNQGILQEFIRQNNEKWYAHKLKTTEEVIRDALARYSTSDSMIRYIKNPNLGFRSNTVNKILPFTINHIWIFNADHEKIYYWKDRISNSLEDSILPRMLFDLSSKNPFLHHSTMYGDQVVEVFGSTVTNSFDIDHVGKPKGYVFFAKTWDKTFIDELAWGTSSSINIVSGKSDEVSKLTRGVLVSLYPIKGPSGKTAAHLVMRNQNPSAEWERRFYVMIVILIISAIILIFSVGFILRRWIASPLLAIIQSVDREDTGPIVNIMGRTDEFGRLARLIRDSLTMKKDLKQEVINRELAMKRFNLAARSARFGIWEWDPSTDIYYWDCNALEIFEISKEEINSLNQAPFSRINPEDKERLEINMRNAISNKNGFEDEVKVLLANGGLLWVKFFGIFQQDGFAMTGKLTGIVHDITEQRHAHDAIKASEERFRLLSENISEVIWTMDATGHFLYISPSVYRTRGYTPIEVMSQSFEEIFTDASSRKIAQVFADKIELIRSGKKFEQEVYVLEQKCKNGSTIWVEIIVQGVYDKDGHFMFVLGVTRDISRRKSVEHALKESEDKYRTAFSTSPDAIALSTFSGMYVEVNASFENLMGFSKAELTGHSVREKQIWNNYRERDILIERLKNHYMVSSYETSLRHKSGHVIPVEIAASAITLNDIPHLLTITRDLTLRKQAEKDLREAKEKAEESSRLKSSLLLNMSHELRTPLNGILGFSQLLGSELSDPDHLKMCEMIGSSGERLMSTLQSIMDLAQAEANQTNVVLEICDLAKIVYAAIAKHKNMFNRKNIQLRHHLEENCIVKVDTGLIQNIMHHLIDNAVKYTDSGCVDISLQKIQSEDLKIVEMKIHDTGIGMTEEQIQFIFDPFRQGDEGIGRKYEGSGLGLTLCRKFIELMGGKISVSSIIGAGSTFTLNFPFVQETHTLPISSVSVSENTAEDIMPYKLRILIVEDNITNVELISRFLQDIGSVTCVYDGQNAVQTAFNNDFDVILMDIGLGQGMNGMETLKEIRKIDRCQKIPIIAVSGYSTNSEIQEIMQAGFSDFLVKPFNRKMLISIIFKNIKQS